MVGLCEYEEARLENIRRNSEKLNSLGLDSGPNGVISKKKQAPQRKRKNYDSSYRGGDDDDESDDDEDYPSHRLRYLLCARVRSVLGCVLECTPGFSSGALSDRRSRPSDRRHVCAILPSPRPRTIARASSATAARFLCRCTHEFTARLHTCIHAYMHTHRCSSSARRGGDEQESLGVGVITVEKVC